MNCTWKRATMNSSIVLILCFLSLTFAATVSAAKGCDKTKCRGPLKFYDEMKCTPVYRSPAECCAYKYICKNYVNRSPKNCFYNGHTYKIGERLRSEDKQPCDICTCGDFDGKAQFACAIIDCIRPSEDPGFYQQRNATQCCAGVPIPINKPDNRSICVVDGKSYRDGEYFKPAGEPEKNCFCGPGYKGKNVEPFCVGPKGTECKTELRYDAEIRKKCAPVYENDQSPQKDCNSGLWRCQNPRDVVVKPTKCVPKPSQAKCLFGNLTLNIGEELNKSTYYDSVCVRCVCEVPPVVTCQRLSSEICNEAPEFATVTETPGK